MRRTEPPPIATWLLEHCAGGVCNEALAGDLREGFSSGLSEGWYWRQVIAACAVSWSETLRLRTPLLIFALLWSTMAPAWKVWINGIGSAPLFRFSQLLGPLWIFPAFAGWLLLNGIFLWAGILVYKFSLSVCGMPSHGKRIRQALLWAPFVYAPVFGATFALCCLDWASPLPGGTLADTPMGQVADWGMLANFIRFPYFITLLSLLWNVIPVSIHSCPLLEIESPPIESSIEVDVSKLVSTADSLVVKRFMGFMAFCGLINAFIASILFGRLLESDLPTFSALLVRSILGDVTGVIAGIAGSWLYWKSPLSAYRERSPIPFPLFALVCASGWIWVPSTAIFLDQLSPAAALVAIIGATSLAIGLRRVSCAAFAVAEDNAGSYELESGELFSQSLYRFPSEVRGYLIAFLLYAGGCALAMRQNLIAAPFLALSSFLFVWTRSSAPAHERDRNHEYRRAALQLACVALPAIFITVWSLLGGMTQRNGLTGIDPVSRAGRSQLKGAGEHQKAKSSSDSSGGYESLILWPISEKKRIIPPISEISALAPGTTQPLIIPFDGQYWYVQPPHKTPGPTAHHAYGTPLGEEISSINSVPLVMDAHQLLGTAVPIARCREIHVEIENRDNKRGVIAMAVLLSDAASPQKRTLYLGQQPIASTEPEHFSFKSEPVFETINFSVPTSAKMRKFDEVTVMLLPDVEHSLIGPKIAIKKFQLFRR